jgi:adenylate cyclase
MILGSIGGLVPLAERMTQFELSELLNMYWGAPVRQDDHALPACRCALRQTRVLEELNGQLPPDKRIKMRTGINSGVMALGSIGASSQMLYTVVGDNVNVASRLVSLNRIYRTSITLGENTHALAGKRTTDDHI